MAEGISSEILDFFDVEEHDYRMYSPLTLAYIGDSIYDLVIRTIVVGRGNTAAHRLHEKTVTAVRAPAQSRMYGVLEPHLTEEEASVMRRGRNAKSPSAAKNASITEYRRATGFEALMGWLYLTGRTDRLLELVKIGLEETGVEI